jgi:glutaconate CoA-transferase, subunit B
VVLIISTAVPTPRKKTGLLGGGPAAVVTDRGVFLFDPETHEMDLSEVFPWQDEEDINRIVKATPWGLKVADHLKSIAPPSEDEVNAVALIHHLLFDP